MITWVTWFLWVSQCPQCKFVFVFCHCANIHPQFIWLTDWLTNLSDWLTDQFIWLTDGPIYLTDWLLYLSQLCPVLWSLQSMQYPVLGSQLSACPLQEQCRQAGKPQWPGRQRSHCRPYAPGTQTHWPVSWSQNWLCEPWGSHAHAAETHIKYTKIQLDAEENT